MTPDDSLLNRLTPLVIAQLDGDIAPCDADELDRLICQDEDARRLYLSLIRESVSLRYWSGSTADNPPARSDPDDVKSALPPSLSADRPIVAFLDAEGPGTVWYFSSGWPVAYLVATVIVGLGLLVGALVHVSTPVQVVHKSIPNPSILAPSPSPQPFVGRITGMVDCQWSDPATEAFNGASVPLGRTYALSSGLMEITYDTGAKVILQGPCTYEVESAAGGFLSVGKLTARVENEVVSSQLSVVSESEIRNQKSETSNPQSPIPNPSLPTIHYPLFTVKTPTATVTDLGTEFGVEVSKEGHTTSHVFQGVVEVQPIARDGVQARAVRLTENESALVEKDENSEGLTVRRGEADPASFVRTGQLPKYAEEVRLRPFRRWQAYSQELRRDPSLLAYYDFEPRQGEPAVLPNRAAKSGGSLDGVIENARWTAGRMPGKHALLFNGPVDCVRVNLPQKTDNLTLSAWVCVNLLMPEQLSSGLLMSDGWLTSGQVHWQLGNPDGHIGFSTIGCVFGSGNAVSPTVVGDQELRRWIQLVCVYDHAAQRVRFYAQGRHVVDIEYGMNVPICIGPACIANWDTEPRTFRGRIDELAIFGRPLPADEIQQMYRREASLSVEP
jgi:hypothetical protein